MDVLIAEMEWLTEVITLRFGLYFSLETRYQRFEDLPAPDLSEAEGEYAAFVNAHQLTYAERVAIGLALMVRLRPQSLDIFFTKNKTFDRNFTEFGGGTQGSLSGFLPTGETLLFVLAGSDMAARCRYLPLLAPTHRLFHAHWLELQAGTSDVARERQVLQLSPELEAKFVWQQMYQPTYGSNFPAVPLHTERNWEELVLQPHTMAQVKEILTWIQHGPTLMRDWEMGKKVRPGHRALFYGPPGTGKTFTAALLGKATGRTVYRVDLSLVVSKYIGETEKNLAKVFNQAERRDWILFFDEADALFGKRTQVQDAQDRYANQEVAFLLQRIEQFDGVVILASNLRQNLDEAFTRRFESIISFALPRPQERLQLWERSLSPRVRAALASSVDLRQLAQSYDLSGGSIMNVMRYVALQAIAQERPIAQQDFIAGIRRELGKEGKTV